MTYDVVTVSLLLTAVHLMASYVQNTEVPPLAANGREKTANTERKLSITLYCKG